MAANKVDLPQPFGPTITVIEPAGITLLSNLDKAVQQYLGTGNKKQNFEILSEAH
jgi:hypothetical protein